MSEILSKLKPPLPPVMVVQHISATFSKLFAARLDRECELTVKEAVEAGILTGEEVRACAGRILRMILRLA